MHPHPRVYYAMLSTKDACRATNYIAKTKLPTYMRVERTRTGVDLNPSFHYTVVG
jgi:hypothetical protein